MSRESDSRRSRTIGSSGSSHCVVNVKTTDVRGRDSAEGIGFCIFRAPQSLSEINPEAYQPKIVPIGPYYHRERHFQKIHEHKRRFSTELLLRADQTTDKLEHFAEALKPKEEEIRRCYSEELDFDSDELIGMMVLDGCFIIELFCKHYYCKFPGHTHPKHDPLLTEQWKLPFLMQDLTKLENQIPWSVLKCLFDLTLRSWNEKHPSLSELALSFFSQITQRKDDVLKKYFNREGEHLLDFLRCTYIPESQETNDFLQLIEPANKLHQAGIKFKPTHCESFMDIKFSNGVLKIPVLKFDDFLSSLFLNFIAFEQCHWGSSKHVTDYAIFMACLLNSPVDAEFLCKRKIIQRFWSMDDEIAHFFSNIRKRVSFNIRTTYLWQVFHDVNRYCEKDLRAHFHRHWTSFKDTYFKSRWYLISAIAAVMLLIMSAIQSFYAVIGYYRPHY